MQISDRLRGRINLCLTSVIWFFFVSGQTGSGKTFTMMGKCVTVLGLSVLL